MTLTSDVETEFQRVLARAKRSIPKNTLLPIFRLTQDEDGLFKGNGFFLNSEGELVHQYSTTGWSEPATPESITQAYTRYGREYSREQALSEASATISSGLDAYLINSALDAYRQ